MEKAKIQPLTTPKSRNRSSPKLACVITSWTTLNMQNFLSIGSGVSVPKILVFAVLLGWLVFSLFFLGSSIRLQPTPLNGFLRKIRQKTSFQVRQCFVGVSITIFDIYTLKFPKNCHFGDQFWLDFFAAENSFNMGMLQYKTTLNRHRSPIKVV